ncbi:MULTISPECIES: aldo/keto reductase [Vitreoscilla]|uniref:Aldo/keto reductase n=1 Tax=Vitreoscilla stercoraria TaxID=61 RepID=A0ABY4EA19_VITST|nr:MULTISPECIES: aldo/keto reductase [Vitreoscilla]AUZ06027.1 aldo/keto reductase family protein [Vitreoscilla sp. C1]UOO92602.1 aldo/keto reductase [Vitreoscilla stercoraria]
MFAPRTLADTQVNPIGLGCMNLSHAYGVPPTQSEAQTLLFKALDLGYNHLDTATLYGFGKNETLIGNTLKSQRQQFFLASKCGMGGVDGKRVIDGRPETLRRQIDESLKRLQTDVIDLYYLHRFDKSVPIEESVGEMGRMVEAGKVRFLGLSEVSAETLYKAHQEHAIAAVQNEYSLWTRNPELGTIAACKDIGATLVAFSPVARGFLGNVLHDTATLPSNDIRLGMPRFKGENFAANLNLLPAYVALAQEAGCTPAQLALYWVLAQADNIVAIPGTTQLQHLADNIAVSELNIAADILTQAGKLINQQTVTGTRYPAATQLEIDTEEF